MLEQHTDQVQIKLSSTIPDHFHTEYWSQPGLHKYSKIPKMNPNRSLPKIKPLNSRFKIICLGKIPEYKRYTWNTDFPSKSVDRVASYLLRRMHLAWPFLTSQTYRTVVVWLFLSIKTAKA